MAYGLPSQFVWVYSAFYSWDSSSLVADVGLTNEANRPRLHRDDERSRGSENVERERKAMQAGSELSGGLERYFIIHKIC